ncbi:ABC transporter substrate-binding protein [Neorhizobium galegae]|uniref:ABC transporter substrate-binding protein n=1 Tax=Neorhizobium galegae TaxID=399 RepID=UPI000621CF11|nr:ABC transporter substrate-binding protein [Neorhizobium galegae]CDZ25443.1 NMT1/THI5 like domain protein [Neorhizobium galegae bv. officinalis]KAA9387683.1 ABC transporter substrate-binding protein [Neorhizobium galegae]KAB1110362.1 ABC transporter substrate-binding protein [Neorhizobium galegae]MCM2499051.1 ABC transporter substrate-binding protein [Neorhizobium galegae]MCQ1772841.1 ABC transporter substrate-binding protein [Neorhizobium galegae]
MSNFTMNRRRFISNAAAAGGLAATSSFLGIRAGNAKDVAKVRMQLGWLVSNGVLGEVAAMKKGFFQEQGIELEIVPGGPSVDGVAGVASGQSATGQISSSPSVMLARSAGLPVKAFLSGYQKHPFTYFSLKNKPIKTPKDMIGKTIATQPTAFILLRALLAKNGIAEDQVKMVNMGSDMNQLITGQADAVTGWLTNVNALDVLGDNRVDMMLWDSGLQLYANVYYTTDDQIAKHSDVLERFTRAAAKGWGYVRSNQKEAVEMLCEAYPILDKASEMKAVAPCVDFSFGPTTKASGWGTMSRENWAAQIKAYADLKQFKGAVPTVDDVANFSILEATADIRKQVG